MPNRYNFFIDKQASEYLAQQSVYSSPQHSQQQLQHGESPPTEYAQQFTAAAAPPHSVQYDFQPEGEYLQQNIRPDMPPYTVKNSSYSSYSFASPHIGHVDESQEKRQGDHAFYPPPPYRSAGVIEPSHPSYYPSPAALAQKVSKISLSAQVANPSEGYFGSNRNHTDNLREFDPRHMHSAASMNASVMSGSIQMSFEQLSRMVASSAALTRFSLREMGIRKMKQLLSRDVGGFADGIASFDGSRILTTVHASDRIELNIRGFNVTGSDNSGGRGGT